MKLSCIIALTVLTVFSSISQETESTGMAGDNLDLNAVLELFKNSDSVEDFENKLNSEKNEVNNLDLNDDGFVDYIRVLDYSDKNSHSLTLQVPYSATESQDLAVIEIEQDDKESTVVQIIGDEDLYGKDYIIEPQSDDMNKSANVQNWKPIKHIYSPAYVIWVSPWRHNHYPTWFRPWKPVTWSIYHGRVNHFHDFCRTTKYRRCNHAHTYYHKHRSHSPAFNSHHNQHHSNGGGMMKSEESEPSKPSKEVSPATPNKSTSSPESRAPSGKPTKRPGAVYNKSNEQTKPTPNSTNTPTKKSQSSPAPKSNTSKPTKRPGAVKSSAKPAAKPTQSKPSGGKH